MKSYQQSTYHRILRVAAAVCAVVLIFESGIVNQSTKDLALQTHLYLANVIGMSAAVEPNGLNEITAEFTRKEQELNAREAALREREITVNLGSAGMNTDKTTYMLAAILFVLLMLIVLNYALDYLRLQKPRRL